jgi:spore maturation protein SpmA
MWDFLTFKRMLTPRLLQIGFWFIIAYCLFVGVYDIASRENILEGFAILILGPIFTRVFCEILILFFRMNETLTDISEHTENKNSKGDH